MHWFNNGMPMGFWWIPMFSFRVLIIVSFVLLRWAVGQTKPKQGSKLALGFLKNNV